MPVEGHSSCGTGILVEPLIELESISRGKDQAQSDVHTDTVLGTISSRRHWAMCVVSLLADGPEYCGEIVRQCAKNNLDKAYAMCDMLCSCSRLDWACGCRGLGRVFRWLRHCQTRYSDSILGVVYSFEDAVRFLWLLDSVSSLLLRGFPSELGRCGQFWMRKKGWLMPTVSVMRPV